MGDLTWARLSDHAISNGRHYITRLLVNGAPGYLLWLDGRLVHQNFTTSRAAREYAAAHEGPEPAAL